MAPDLSPTHPPKLVIQRGPTYQKFRRRLECKGKDITQGTLTKKAPDRPKDSGQFETQKRLQIIADRSLF
jgi:hypothetical protein